ncbi:MAG TPA: glycosyltransferase, partial [Bryobacteraceae bacterium]|nr:glycosyltransferase [Bryobacteraceae bacterium]
MVFAGLVLQTQSPYWAIRWLALAIAPHRTLFFNENLNHFMLRPHGTKAIARHLWWRLRSFARFQLNPGGTAYTWAWRLSHPEALKRPLSAYQALRAGNAAAARRRKLRPAAAPALAAAEQPGISVVIPSRNGRDLLARLLPPLLRELGNYPHEVIVVDNGSDDDTSAFLHTHFPAAKVLLSKEPLSFAAAINRGAKVSQFRYTCLLNNDMVPHEGFFGPLLAAFDSVPDLFCATSQIFFPEGKRREETGKACARPIRPGSTTLDFPLQCLEPLPGEDLSYALYGSGGCSLYESRMFKALGGLDEVFIPAYVEDLDCGVRAWQCGWPTVFVAASK